MNETFLELAHANPWVERLVDLPGLNASVSEAIESRVLETRRKALAAPAELPSASMVFLGPPGIGKTHIFARLRKRLGPKAVFVHIRPLLHGPLTISYVLGQVLRQLSQKSFSVFQLDSLVGSLLAFSVGENPDFPSAYIEECRALAPEVREQRLQDLVDRLCGTWSDVDEAYLERLVKAPFVSERERRALVAWLSGEDCDPSQLARIGASSSLAPERCARALRTLSSVAAVGAPLVIAFDQLENLVSKDGVEERIHQYGNLVAELVDGTRGVILTQFALDSEWARAIDPVFNVSQRSRVAMYVGQLALPTAKQRLELLELWREQLADDIPPFPWPFDASAIKRLTEMFDATPRMLLTAFREARAGLPVAILEGSAAESEGAGGERSETTDNALDDQLQSALVEAHHAIDIAEKGRSGVPEGRLLDGLLSAFEILAWDGRPTGRDCPQLRVQGAAGAAELTLLHQGHPRSVAAVLGKLRVGGDAKLVILREHWREFPPTWKESNARLSALRTEGAVFLPLERQDVALLLALESLLKGARSGDIVDPRGRSLEVSVVLEYLRRAPILVEARLVAALEGCFLEASDAAPSEDRNESGVEPPLVPESGNAPEVGVSKDREAEESPLVRIALESLRVASIDRLVREVKRHSPSANRASTIEALRHLGGRVEWFGRNIVAVRSSHV